MADDITTTLLLAVAGPLTATIIGTLIIGSIASFVSMRNQDRRARFELRHELVTAMPTGRAVHRELDLRRVDAAATTPSPCYGRRRRG